MGEAESGGAAELYLSQSHRRGGTADVWAIGTARRRDRRTRAHDVGMGATSKFIWPIPDKGLKKRIHRVSAPRLILWGADDRLVPSIYADEFSKRLARTRVHIITGA